MVVVVIVEGESCSHEKDKNSPERNEKCWLGLSVVADY